VGTIFNRDLFQTSVGWVPFSIETCFKPVLGGYQLFGENLCIAVTTFFGILLQVSSALSTKFVVSLTSVFTFQPHQNEGKLFKILGGYHI
jgi:hypothetical protein